MRPRLTFVKQTACVVTGVDLLIVIVMARAIIGFALVSLVRGSRTTDQTNFEVGTANQLRKTRLDSIRRQPMALDQTAQLKVL